MDSYDTVLVYYLNFEEKITWKLISTKNYILDGRTLRANKDKYIINNVTGITEYKKGKAVRSYDL
jgi:hypothetical protein